MLAAFFSGFCFGLLFIGCLWLLRVAVTMPMPGAIAEDDRPVLACPNCGRTGGRQGPFRSPKALHGHARVCKVKESNPGPTGA